MCIESITCEKLPPESLTATDGGFARPMLRALNTSRYRTCTSKSNNKGSRYEFAVSQRVCQYKIEEKFVVRKSSDPLPWSGIPEARLLTIRNWATPSGRPRRSSASVMDGKFLGNT